MLGYYLQLAVRSLQRNKVLTALMVLAIGVGIGASMTTLTVMHALSGDPLPGKSNSIFYPQVDPTPADWSKDNHPLPMMDYHSAVDLWSAQRADRQAPVVGSSIKVHKPGSALPPMMLSLLSTGADFFLMFDVPFQYGAGWSRDDGKSRARVAVITHDLNMRLFGGRNSVGERLRLGDESVRIVGVMAPWRPAPRFYSVYGAVSGFGGGMQPYGKTEDVFVPFLTGIEINAGAFRQYTCWGDVPRPGYLVNAPCLWVALWVQLDSAAKVAEYRAFVSHYAEQQKAIGRYAQTDTRMLDLMAWLDHIQVVPDDVQLQTWLAFAFLGICLFNTIGLLLAKYLRHAGAIGVRRALGATRGAVFAQCLVEAGMIGLLGGILGWLLTLAGLWLVRRQPSPYTQLAHMDLAMFATTFVLAVLASLLAGALPAMRASRVPPALQLKIL